MNIAKALGCRVRMVWQVLLIVMIMAVMPLSVQADQVTPNMITFENQSGRNAVVRVIGPTRAVAKMQRDESRIVRVAAGEYYILVRYGDSKKEYSYTKSAAFFVTQSEKQVSMITFILHRRHGGTFNSQPVSDKEFEAGVR
ncbi:MAG: hypothetical protein ACPGYT_00230 [Nitrospirales bacterium]